MFLQILHICDQRMEVTINSMQWHENGVAVQFRWLFQLIHDQILYGGHIVSLGLAAMVSTVMLLLGQSFRWEFLLIVYLGTLCVYNYDHIRDSQVDDQGNRTRSQYLTDHRRLYVLLLLSYVSLFFVLLVVFGNLNSVIIGVVMLVISVLYTDVFKKLTRHVVGFKNVFTSVFLSLLLVFTLVYYELALSSWFVLFTVFVFLHFLLDTSFCDLKDMDDDQRKGLKTLPVWLGTQRYLWFAHGLNLLSFGVLVGAVLFYSLPWFALGLLTFFIYRIWYIEHARRTPDSIPFLCHVAVDAEYLFWPLVVGAGLVLCWFA